MNVYISVDMEGVAGVSSREQLSAEGHDYADARRLMVEEANAAVAGAFDAGATRVVVNDSHGPMTNILPEELDDRAELIRGREKVSQSMTEGLGPEFDVALFVGYHSRSGVESSPLAHTYSGAAVYDIRLNGVPMGETDLNARVAAVHGVPLGMVTGDDVLCAEIRERFPWVRAVEVKVGRGQGVAGGVHPKVARQRIREGAAATVADIGSLRVVDLTGPFEIEVDFLRTSMAEACALTPGAVRKGGRTVAFTSDDYLEAFRCMLAWLYIAAAV